MHDRTKVGNCFVSCTVWFCRISTRENLMGFKGVSFSICAQVIPFVMKLTVYTVFCNGLLSSWYSLLKVFFSSSGLVCKCRHNILLVHEEGNMVWYNLRCYVVPLVYHLFDRILICSNWTRGEYKTMSIQCTSVDIKSLLHHRLNFLDCFSCWRAHVYISYTNKWQGFPTLLQRKMSAWWGVDVFSRLSGLRWSWF